MFQLEPNPTGSSPRLRGTRRAHDRGRPQGRFIPAFAGNAICCICAADILSVHPRVCGERFSVSRRQTLSNGSSPRLRGTPFTVQHLHLPHRFIPAFAGNATTRRHPRKRRPVHPRVCGERSTTPAPKSWRTGSSPRLRGTRTLSERLVEERRFIPAFAGNAPAPGPRAAPAPVHPRVCGEREFRRRRVRAGDGSSPRLRGTHSRRPGALFGLRFIPAFAGNAWSAGARPGRWPVHPRVCGERPGSAMAHSSAAGSSPRLRGTPSRTKRPGPPCRFIPAFAGNARRAGRSPGQAPVHPRVCGERGTDASLG